jgi:hypothetical protein
MAWEKIKSSQVLGKMRGLVRETAEWSEVMHILETSKLQPGEAMRLRKLPKMNGVKHPHTCFAVNLNKEIKRLDLPYRAGTYGGEVYVKHIE